MYFLSGLDTWVPYSELNQGRASTPKEFRTELSRFSRGPMLRLCALMNNLMYGLNADADESTHHQILAQLCGPQSLVYPRLRPLLSTRWVLHRQQFLKIG